jgi:spore germination cell wall hydrolase CwlJ-like protein
MNLDFNKLVSLVLYGIAVCAITVSVTAVIDSGKRTADIEVKQLPLVDAPSLAPKNPIEMTPEEVKCLATNIYHEARGENRAGRIAVAHVTINRVWHHRYPDKVCDVVYDARYFVNWRGNRMPRRHQCQFSWYCDGKSDNVVLVDNQGTPIEPNVKAWQESLSIARGALEGIYPDNTGGATHYFNPDLADPHWQQVYDRVAVVGNHNFYVSTYR